MPVDGASLSQSQSAGSKAGDAGEPAAVLHAPELSVVLPTFNERDNLPVLIERLDVALAGIAWEAIVVDDNSPTARRRPRVSLPTATRASASSAGSAGAGFRAPASRACWRLPPTTSR